MFSLVYRALRHVHPHNLGTAQARTLFDTGDILFVDLRGGRGGSATGQHKKGKAQGNKAHDILLCAVWGA